MIVCVDVDYRAHESVTAAVGIRVWTDEVPVLERVQRLSTPAAPYLPGQFYLREMPAIVDILAGIADVEQVVIDGYVWLGTDRPGLGAHLYQQLGARVPVVGVAKQAFHGNDRAVAVTRGRSTRPLHVTAVGVDASNAADHVRSMHGAYRLPTILKRTDRLARDA